MLHPGLKGVTELGTESKGRFESFKVAPSKTDFCAYASERHNTREQLARGCFFEELQNYMKNKNEEH